MARPHLGFNHRLVRYNGQNFLYFAYYQDGELIGISQEPAVNELAALTAANALPVLEWDELPLKPRDPPDENKTNRSGGGDPVIVRHPEGKTWHHLYLYIHDGRVSPHEVAGPYQTREDAYASYLGHPPMFKREFTMDYLIDPKTGKAPWFVGYTTGEKWNGWSTPWFTKEEALKYMNAHNATLRDKRPNKKARFSPRGKMFVFPNENDPQFPDKIAPDNVPGVLPDGEDEDDVTWPVYPFGSLGWTWVEREIGSEEPA